MHFASAAALLLRELGVPARYVSGYMVNRALFEVADDTSAHATVTDYTAHAWVEVYLDYIGWIPLEVTPGYNNSNEFPTMQDPQELEEKAEEFRENLKDSEAESESGSKSESESNSESGNAFESESELQQTPNVPPQPSESESEQKNPGGIGIGGNSGAGSALDFTVLLKWCGIAVFIMGIITLIRNRIRQFDAILEREVRQKYTRRAIKRMNRRLYRRLLLSKRGFSIHIFRKGKGSDAEYETALIATYTQVSPDKWHRYMQIVRKTHYSMEDISVEEMEYCYGCYKKIRG